MPALEFKINRKCKIFVTKHCTSYCCLPKCRKMIWAQKIKTRSQKRVYFRKGNCEYVQCKTRHLQHEDKEKEFAMY